MPKKNLSLLQKGFILLDSKHLTRFIPHPFAKKVRGFTFIEAMVAISLLMTSVAIAVTVIRTNILVSSITKDAVAARFLAQEGIEYTRHVRDSHLVDFEKNGNDPPIDWLGTLEACFDGTPCIINMADPTSVNITSCPVGGCPVLKYNETENRYGYDSGADWEETPFIREIQITHPAISCVGAICLEAIVTVKVVWNEHGGPDKEVVYQQNLFNWIDEIID